MARLQCDTPLVFFAYKYIPLCVCVLVTLDSAAPHQMLEPGLYKSSISSFMNSAKFIIPDS